MAVKPEPAPGERQAGESARAFAAFRLYMELGPRRTTADVGRRLGHRSERQAQTWSSKHRWVERVAAVASADARAADTGRQGELQAIARRQAQHAALHVAATSVIASELVRRLRVDPTLPERLDDETLIRYIAPLSRAHVRAVGLERLVAGMTTDQPGEPVPREQAAEEAASLTDQELEARLTGIDAPEPRRLRRNGAQRRLAPPPGVPPAPDGLGRQSGVGGGTPEAPETPVEPPSGPRPPAAPETREGAAERRRRLMSGGRPSVSDLRHRLNHEHQEP